MPSTCKAAGRTVGVYPHAEAEDDGEYIAAEVRPDGPRGKWFLGEVEDHWRYSQASTVSSGSIEMQRILLSRALLAAAK